MPEEWIPVSKARGVRKSAGWDRLIATFEDQALRVGTEDEHGSREERIASIVARCEFSDSVDRQEHYESIMRMLESA